MRNLGSYRFVATILGFTIMHYVHDTNLTLLEKKFLPGPGFEPGSPALRAGAITTKPPRRSTRPS